jgi:hypothetical protein
MPLARWSHATATVSRLKGNSHMSKPRPSPPTVMFAITMVLALPASALAQVRVLMSGGFRAAYQELLPQFEQTTGITVTTAAGSSQGDGPNTIAAQLRRGVSADVVIMSRVGLAELFKDGRIAAGSDVDLARVLLGVGVRAGRISGRLTLSSRPCFTRNPSAFKALPPST